MNVPATGWRRGNISATPRTLPPSRRVGPRRDERGSRPMRQQVQVTLTSDARTTVTPANAVVFLPADADDPVVTPE